MAKKTARKGGGSTLTRSQTVTVRLDPKLRYLAGLAARKHRRTLSSFIEWAVEQSLEQVVLHEGTGYGNDNHLSVADEAERLWDIDEADRFARLALSYPEMLTHDEQILWKLAKENGYFWRGRMQDKKWQWSCIEVNLHFDRLRDHWKTLIDVATGKSDAASLPKWAQQTSELEAENDYEIPL